MSKQYPGGIISKTAPTPSGSFENSTAPGIWTLEQQAYWQKLGQWPIPGNVPNYIEDMFSTYLYKGNNSTLSINNGINVSGKGGLVWIKNRQQSGYYHTLVDTARGASNQIYSNASDVQYTATGLDVTAFTSTGFTLGPDNFCNQNNGLNVAWTFREQSKFFDIVTYTGNGVAGRQISHNLGATPGCIIVKCTSDVENWKVYHRSLGGGTGDGVLRLDTTDADQGTAYGKYNWGNNTIFIAPTSSVFTVATDGSINANGRTYVAYLFAHNAGGFGLAGTDNVISCGSYTTGSGGSAGTTVELGYEPQWVMVKRSSGVGSWYITDIMRGMSMSANGGQVVVPNTSAAEANAWGGGFFPTATGFRDNGVIANSSTMIYIAIRRGPMAAPTLGTSVFTPNTATYSANQVATAGFPVDMLMMKGRTISFGNLAYDRLRGLASTNTTPVDPQLLTSDTSAEVSGNYVNTVNNTGYQISPGFSSFSSVNWNFRRAPGFFDVACYTASAYTDLIYHNLGVAPEMIIAKNRGATTTQWYIYHTGLGAGYEIYFNTNAKSSGPTWTSTSTYWNQDSALYPLGEAHVSYLFATLAGVSKVGSYTGTGAAQTINCGFTTGARFVLIKRTDSTGDWYVWDSARGIIPANDPYLLLNVAGTETTGTDYIDTTSVGFDVTSTAPAALNANGGNYIFLAIA